MRSNDTAGFTLIELLLVLGITSGFLVVVVSFGLNISEQNLRQNLIHVLSAEAQVATQRMEYIIRNAEGVDLVAENRIELGKIGSSGQDVLFLRDERIYFDDGTSESALTSTDMRVTSLVFEDYSVASARSDGIGYQINIEPNRGLSGGESIFQTSLSLRGAAQVRSSHIP